MNNKEKSLRWVVNQIPDFEPKTEEEKMLLAIKRYCKAGADEIKNLEHRAKVLELALENALKCCHCINCELKKGCKASTCSANDWINWDVDEEASYCKKRYLDQAENELAEERK